jgi:outer membrane lipoprotein-sorting protein
LYGESLPPPPEAGDLVQRAFDYYRDKASVAEVRMTIHRPDWERTQVMHAWTVGEEESLFTIVDPPKDRGNGTLKRGNEMWTFNPKVNRIIKLPPSMMAQSWMGSDFSNNDLAKADALVKDYTHELTGQEERDGHVVYTVESTPLPEAPVIWGKEILKIRDDLVFLEEAFYDEQGELVKTLRFEQIEMISGKLYPRLLVMRPADKEDHYTKVEYLELEFRETLPDRYFTRGALRTPPSPDLE